MRSMHDRCTPVMSASCASRNAAADGKSGASASAERRLAICRSPGDATSPNWPRSPVLLLKPASQLHILALYAFKLAAGCVAELPRTRDRCRDADGLGVLEVRVDRSHDDSCFDGHEVDADQRHTDPRVDDDTLVEYAIEYVDEGTA